MTSLSNTDRRRAAATTPLRICSWNLENFDATNAAKLNGIADAIVHTLRCPHILAVQEMLGSTAMPGEQAPTNPTAEALIDAIANRSGRYYRYCEVTPALNESSSKPEGNIRNGFFYRTDRVQLSPPLEASGASSNHVFAAHEGIVRLQQANPRAVLRKNQSFRGPRKPLLAQFDDTQSWERYCVLNVHLKANPGLYPTQHTDASDEFDALLKQREQARLLSDFVKNLRFFYPASHENADQHLILCGDFNAQVKPPALKPHLRDTLEIIDQAGLQRITDDLPEGSSHRIGEHTSNLDHIYVSLPLACRIGDVSRPTLNLGDVHPPPSDHNPTMFCVTPHKSRHLQSPKGVGG